MNRPLTNSTHAQTTNAAAYTAKPANAPWWQLYSVLIITLGTGIVLAVNDPALLTNPIVLLVGVGAFFGFVLVWSTRHASEIEAEDWPAGQATVPDETEPTSTNTP